MDSWTSQSNPGRQTVLSVVCSVIGLVLVIDSCDFSGSGEPDKRRAAQAWECRLVRRARLSPRHGYHRLGADHRPGALREKRAVRQPMVPKG